jgi:glycerate kinase
MRAVIAPDKFKGSLSAHEAACALAAGLARIPGLIADCCPVADGGEGFAEALAKRWTEVQAIADPLGRPVIARYGWSGDAMAVIEMSEASGHRRLKPEERNPWQTSTFGTGQLIRHAASQGASVVAVGLGGSATNDAGAGAAAALGWQFLTSDGEPVEAKPANFLAIERIQPPESEDLPRIVAACDVRNPLLGPEGASRVYARQKGADDRMIEHLEMALEHLADLVAEQVGVDHRLLPGAGAAGGLGYGLATFCGAEMTRGFTLVAEALRLEERIAASDFVITGEGRIDSQTRHGKAPAEVARLAKKYGKPVAAVCGECEPGGGHSEWFDFVVALRDFEPSPERSMANAKELLGRAAERIAEWAARNRNIQGR